jgi:hypothetical protein
MKRLKRGQDEVNIRGPQSYAAARAPPQIRLRGFPVYTLVLGKVLSE